MSLPSLLGLLLNAISLFPESQYAPSLVIDPQYTEQGAYWSWKGGGDQLMDNYWDSGNREIALNNKPSKEGRDMEKAQAVFDYSSALVDYKPSPAIKKLDSEAVSAR